jgi:hypothetical protein
MKLLNKIRQAFPEDIRLHLSPVCRNFEKKKHATSSTLDATDRYIDPY